MIPPSTTITPEGKRLRRTLLWLAAGVVAVNLIVWVASSLTSGGAVSGPGGSSYVTTRSGSAALAGALDRLGVDVIRSRDTLDASDLRPDMTVVISDVGASSYSTAELNSLDAHLRGGGRIVVAGQASMIERLVAEAPGWRSSGANAASPTDDLDLAPASSVPLSGFGSLEPTPSDVPILVGTDDTVVAIERPVGEGTLVWLGDSFPFHNEGIGVPDAAVAAIALLSPEGPVLFDEYRHGFTDEGGLWSLLPSRWRLTLLLGGVVALLGLVAYGRRFGPPHDRQRRLPPGREMYLDAVSGMLARSQATSATLETIRREARRRLAERAPHADPESAARGMGLEENEIQAVFAPGDDDETLVAADRALATLNREKQGP